MSTMIKEKKSLSYVLNNSDRCDSCSAQAYVLIKGVSGELMFCAHHFIKNEDKLREFAYEIVDERSRLEQINTEE